MKLLKPTAITLGLIGFVLMLGYAGHVDRNTQLMNATATRCEASGGPSSTPVGRECAALITELQSSGQYEVRTDGAKYWIEEK